MTGADLFADAQVPDAGRCPLDRRVRALVLKRAGGRLAELALPHERARAALWTPPVCSDQRHAVVCSQCAAYRPRQGRPRGSAGRSLRSHPAKNSSARQRSNSGDFGAVLAVMDVESDWGCANVVHAARCAQLADADRLEFTGFGAGASLGVYQGAGGKRGFGADHTPDVAAVGFEDCEALHSFSPVCTAHRVQRMKTIIEHHASFCKGDLMLENPKRSNVVLSGAHAEGGEAR